MENRQCNSCNKPLRGRADKKFCDDYCRNNFNNQLRIVETKLVRNINNVLLRNRRILAGFLSDNERVKKLRRELLSGEGFLFGYHTHQKASRGNVYRFCYEYGYFENANGEIIVRKE